VSGQVYGQRRLAESDDHGVKRMGVLTAAVKKHHAWRFGSPAQRTDITDVHALDAGRRPGYAGLPGIIVEEREFRKPSQLVLVVPHNEQASP
jgi:hypothetical protein